MNNTLWYDKYRPTTIDDYVWTNDETRDKLIAWIHDPIAHPHLLLAGPTGTGKTTLAKIIRDTLRNSADTKFIPASLRSGVDTIRDEIVGFCEAGGFLGIKLIVLDEADRLSPDAQQMMRNVMDRYTDDVRFIFTCNYPEKIISAIRGRMWSIDIDAIDEDAFTDRLIDIATTENINLETSTAIEQLTAIVADNYPNLRHAISELQWRTVDGELQPPTHTDVNRPWESELLGQMESFDVNTSRALVATMRVDDFESAYRLLYGNSHKFGEFEDEAILVIAEYLFRHASAGLPDITLCACLIKLSEILE